MLAAGFVLTPLAGAGDVHQVKKVIAAKNAVAEHPDSVQAHREYQSAMIEEGWKAQILEEYAGRLKQARTPGNLYLWARLQEGEEEAPAFETLVKEFPDFSWGYFGLATVEEKQGDVGEAIRLSERALELDPLNVLVYQNLASYHEAHGDIEKSLQTIERGLQSLPDDPGLLAYRGAYLRLLKRYEEARPDLEKVLEQQPDDRVALWNLLFLFTETKDAEAALAIGERYLALWPQGRQAWVKMALNHLALYDRRHDIEHLLAAEEACEQAIQTDPTDLDAYYALYNYFTDRDWWVHGLYYNNKARQLTDRSASVYEGLEHNFAWIPSAKMGTSSFRIEAVEPASPEAGASAPGREHLVQAIAAMREKNYRQARLSLKQAVELAPDDPVVRYHQTLMRMFDEAVVGGALEQLHQYRDAVKAGAGINLDTFEVFVEPFERYLQRDPTSPEIYEAFGDIFDADPGGAYRTSALPYYEKALELGGDQARLSEKIQAIRSVNH